MSVNFIRLAKPHLSSSRKMYMNTDYNAPNIICQRLDFVSDSNSGMIWFCPLRLCQLETCTFLGSVSPDLVRKL